MRVPDDRPDIWSHVQNALVVDSGWDASYYREHEQTYYPHRHAHEAPTTPLAEQLLELEDMSRDIRAALHTLPFRWQFVLLLRYGLLDGQQMGQVEIGRIMGITRQAVSLLELKALKRLRARPTLGAARIGERLHLKLNAVQRRVRRGKDLPQAITLEGDALYQHWLDLPGVPRKVEARPLGNEFEDHASDEECAGCYEKLPVVTRESLDGITLCAACYAEAFKQEA